VLYAVVMAQFRRRTSLFSLDDVLDQICADYSGDDFDGNKSRQFKNSKELFLFHYRTNMFLQVYLVTKTTFF
jgi:hypothetical protein